MLPAPNPTKTTITNGRNGFHLDMPYSFALQTRKARPSMSSTDIDHTSSVCPHRKSLPKLAMSTVLPVLICSASMVA